jgi:serine/threonine-protein kinase
VTVLAGRYALLEQVGEGGMSVVWRARDDTLERDVAVKLLRSFVASDPELRARFGREARTLAALSNDHIVRLYDYVDAGEQVFLVMEYVDGGNLAESTFGRLPLPPAEAAAYVLPIAKALAYAHGRGVVHRDLTPTNILIERETGRVLASDFGLARIARSAGSLTAPGVLIGTPEYWSPEQALGRDSDGAADVYALGCILFLLLSGRLPFEGEDRLAIGLRRAHEDAPSLRTHDAEVRSLVDSLLAREPSRRPDAAAAAAALSALASRTATRPAAADAPTIAGPTEQPTVRREPRRRRRRRVVLGVVGTAVASAALVFAIGKLREPVLRAPNVVSLREGDARAKINRLLPGANVLISQAYSTRIPSGRVIGQRPAARARLRGDAAVRLIVSKGTPFAAVPSLAGRTAATAKSALVHAGFQARYRYTPSWTTRKGSVVDLRPAPGTLVRRPARVTIVVASGYPRAVVPDVSDSDLTSAESRLTAKHLRTYVVYQLTHAAPANQVLRQMPSAGATVYRGTRVRLTVARQLRWVTVLARSGDGGYVSRPFTVPRHWRIHYRVSGGFGPALAQFRWARNGDLFADGSFFANDGGDQTHAVTDGAGTYRLAVSAYAGTSWSVEVQALE